MQKSTAGTMLNLLCACLLTMTIGNSLAQQVTDPNAMAATIAEEKAEHEVIIKANAQITTRLNDLTRIANADDKIHEILLLSQEVGQLINDLNLATKRQASLAAWLDKVPDNREQLSQEQAFRANFRKELDKMGGEQNKLKSLLTKRQEQLRMLLNRMPPPASFTTDTGITLVLIAPETAGAKKFYISSQPITRQQYQNVLQAWNNRNETAEHPLLDNPESPMCGLTFPQALQFCQAISKLEGTKANCHLPTVAEISAVSKLPMPSIAVWSSTPWGDKQGDEFDIQKRFGMQMQTVWDPAHALTEDTAQVFFRELPFATYDKLGVIVAADLQTGIANRLNRLLRELQNGGK